MNAYGRVSCVVGVDPSLTCTGVGFHSASGSGTLAVKSVGHDGDDLDMRLRRVNGLAFEVLDAVRLLRPAVIVYETPAYAQSMSSDNYHYLAGFWWLLVYGLHKIAPIATVTPTTLKKFTTGNGGSATSKAVMRQTMRDAFPHLTIKTHDEADALAMATMAAERFGVEYVGELSSMYRGSLAVAKWPDLGGGEIRW